MVNLGAAFYVLCQKENRSKIHSDLSLQDVIHPDDPTFPRDMNPNDNGVEFPCDPPEATLKPTIETEAECGSIAVCIRPTAIRPERTSDHDPPLSSCKHIDNAKDEIESEASLSQYAGHLGIQQTISLQSPLGQKDSQHEVSPFPCVADPSGTVNSIFFLIHCDNIFKFLRSG